MKLAGAALVALALVVVASTGGNAGGYWESGVSSGVVWNSWSNQNPVSLMNNPPPAPGPGYGFRYESQIQYDAPPADPALNGWDYDWYIENNSTTRSIVSWTWEHQSYWNAITQSWDVVLHTYSGTLVMSSPNPTLATGDRGPWGPNFETELPLPPVPVVKPIDWPTHANAAEEYAQFYWSPPVTVVSTVTWDDNYSEQWNVFVPLELVPEPGSLLALSLGVAGFASLVRRKGLK